MTAIASISPTIAKNVSDYQEKGKIDPNSVSQIAVVLATTGLTILGRLDATAPLYTLNELEQARIENVLKSSRYVLLKPKQNSMSNTNDSTSISLGSAPNRYCTAFNALS